MLTEIVLTAEQSSTKDEFLQHPFIKDMMESGMRSLIMSIAKRFATPMRRIRDTPTGFGCQPTEFVVDERFPMWLKEFETKNMPFYIDGKGIEDMPLLHQVRTSNGVGS